MGSIEKMKCIKQETSDLNIIQVKRRREKV